MSPVYNIAILASGKGSNAEQIIQYFQKDERIQITLVISNNPNPGVKQKASRNNIPFIYISNKDFTLHYKVLPILTKYQVTHIVLAGFLRLIPPYLIENYPSKIINIHPSLLPKYGGKGMYGSHVHKAVLQNKEPESGISIHLVNEEYDQGKLLFQAKTSIQNLDCIEDIQKKIHILEHKYYSKVIKAWILEPSSFH